MRLHLYFDLDFPEHYCFNIANVFLIKDFQYSLYTPIVTGARCNTTVKPTYLVVNHFVKFDMKEKSSVIIKWKIKFLTTLSTFEMDSTLYVSNELF